MGLPALASIGFAESVPDTMVERGVHRFLLPECDRVFQPSCAEAIVPATGAFLEAPSLLREFQAPGCPTHP